MANTAVYGMFPDRMSLNKAIDALRGAGFREADISVLYSEGPGTLDFGHEKHTKIPEGAATGGSAGSIVGAVLGWLAGAGKLNIPRTDAFVSAGPVVSTLAGAGIGGSIGWIIGAMIGVTVPEYEAKRYSGQTRHGVLLSVHSDDSNWEKRAKSVLGQTGAEEIGSRAEAKAA